MVKCLILSNGPVPTPEHGKVEGGGLRCWGLAKGIISNSSDTEVTIAYNDSYKVDGKHTDNFEGVDIATWNIENVKTLIKSYDSIIVSYCMGDLSTAVSASIRPDQQLILDCYVPIYVEVSARDSSDKEGEYHAFTNDVYKWAEVLKRGDVFLCASEPQKKFYEGVLAAVGRINPVTYGDDMILIVPYGIYRELPKIAEKPIDNLIGKDADKYKKVLWFGGIYPWFDLRSLVDAVKEVNEKVPTKLVIVGAKNPFNSHPDFTARYDELIEYINQPDNKNYVIEQQWVDFNDRLNWYANSDLVVVMNRLGQENNLAWRTRLVDFVWADLPVLTNGGDPMSEYLISHDAALQFQSEKASDIANDLEKFLANDKKSKKLVENISKVKSRFYWDTVTSELSKAIEDHRRAKDLSSVGVYAIHQGEQAYGNSQLERVLRKARKVPAYAKKYGYKNTYIIASATARSKVKKLLQRGEVKGDPALVFVSHQLDMSGAPFIIMDMASEVLNKYPDLNLNFFTYTPVHSKNILDLNQLGIKPQIITDKNASPPFTRSSIVVLNTTAHSEPVKDEIFTKLESGYLKKLIWYVHEDDPELLFRLDEKKRIEKLLYQNKLEFFIAAKKMQGNYQKYFGSKNGISFVTYKHKVKEGYKRVLKAADFNEKLVFSLPGTVSDGRKGQLPVFYAFVEFYNRYYKQNPRNYRDFELSFIGLTDDFLSRQLIKHKNALDGRFKYYGKMTNDECMELVTKANMTICYSMRECLPLFVFEGMATGHPILRNDSSGIDEQLEEGVNGFGLRSEDYNHLVETVEVTLNKTKTTNKQLESMSKQSNRIALAQESNSYIPALKNTLRLLDE